MGTARIEPLIPVDVWLASASPGQETVCDEVVGGLGVTSRFPSYMGRFAVTETS